MGYRRKAREAALAYLYQQDYENETSTATLRSFYRHFYSDATNEDFFAELVEGVIAAQEELDQKISAIADNWKLPRMARIDRILLRMASWEIIYSSTPYKVVIDEAVEIARKYSTTESAAFVNGILDRMANPEAEKDLEDRALNA